MTDEFTNFRATIQVRTHCFYLIYFANPYGMCLHQCIVTEPKPSPQLPFHTAVNQPQLIPLTPHTIETSSCVRK